MLESRGSTPENPPSQQAKVARFLRENRITIDEVKQDDGITRYHFVKLGVEGDPTEVATIEYDTTRKGVLPHSPEEWQRRLKTPGFITEVSRPFAKLLIREKGDFMLGDSFRPIHEVTEELEGFE